MATPLKIVQSTLTGRVKESLGSDLAETLVGGTHTQRFDDNLLPTLTLSQARRLRKQLAAGLGGELTARKGSGKRTGHAPYSSAALAINAFGRWLDAEGALTVAGLTGFTCLAVEGQLQIAHGGGLANLDVLLKGPNKIVGVESKLCETLSEHEPTAWKDAYGEPEMRALLDERWAHVLDLSLDGAWQPRRLGVEQLLKHALALRSTERERERHLVYVFWEPENGDDVDCVKEHRAELALLREHLGAAPDPLFRALSYAQLWAEWEFVAAGAPWLASHLDALRSRYSLSI